MAVLQVSLSLSLSNRRETQKSSSNGTPAFLGISVLGNFIGYIMYLIKTAPRYRARSRRAIAHELDLAVTDRDESIQCKMLVSFVLDHRLNPSSLDLSQRRAGLKPILYLSLAIPSVFGFETQLHKLEVTLRNEMILYMQTLI